MPASPTKDSLLFAMSVRRSQLASTLGRLVVTFAGCAVLVYVGLRWSPLAGRPIVDLSAGAALVALLRWGRWMALPAGLGMALGWQAWLQGNSCLTGVCATWVDALILGSAGALRALLGAWLLRVPSTVLPMLEEPRDVARFFVRGAVLPSLAATALALTCGVAFGALGTANLWPIGASHWASGTLGTVIGTTLLWAWLGQPSADWVPRRWPVTLVTLIGTASIHVASHAIARAEYRRNASDLDRAAAFSSNSLRAQAQVALHALRAMHSLFVNGRAVSRDEFRLAAEPWLRAPSQLQALGWSEILSDADVPRFEARARAEGFPGLRVVSADGKGGVRGVRPGEPLAVIRFIEPMAENRLAPGINSRANPVAAVAIEQALAREGPAATSSFPLRLPAPTAPGERGVVLYEAVTAPAADGREDQHTRGLVFATIRISQLWQAVQASSAPGVTLCMFERGAASAVELAGAPNCPSIDKLASAMVDEPRSANDDLLLAPLSITNVGLTVVRPVDVGDRRWYLVVTDSGVAAQRIIQTVTDVSLTGFAGVAVLIGLLLVITGRARRVEMAVAEARAARDAAHEANQAKTRFLSHMSHDLRTPLNAVLGFAQLIETDHDPRTPAAYQRWARKIRHAGEYLLEMIGEILDLSRIESGTLRLDVGLLDVRQAVGEAVALVESTAAAQGITLEVHHGAEVHTLRGDPTRVRQILVNLLSNAIKYNSEGGWVAVRTRRHDGRVDIAVQDGGLGMGPDQVAQLFQPFNRLGREGSSVEGTGIGLVICQRLAQTMWGEIRVESRRDEGSTFTLVLPASDEVVVPPAEAAAGQGSRGGGGFERPLRVHYIEDDPVNREVVHAMLERYGELSLDCSATGAEALRKLRDGAEAPDLILLDLNLPDCDGISLLQTLRAEPATARVPVVVLSADVMPEMQVKAREAGADDCIAKPTRLDVLLAAVHRYDTRPRASADASISVPRRN